MGKFGGFYKGERKKLKKTILDKKAKAITASGTFILPSVVIIKKGKKDVA